MDPNETLLSWACAVLSEDRYMANEHYCALRAWFDKGGFEPNWEGYTRPFASDMGPRLPSRKQFFSYDVRTGRIGRIGKGSSLRNPDYHDSCVICQNEGGHDVYDRPHVMEGQE